MTEAEKAALQTLEEMRDGVMQRLKTVNAEPPKPETWLEKIQLGNLSVILTTVINALCELD